MMFSRQLFFCTGVLLVGVCRGLLYPGDPTPDFSLPTLSGEPFTNIVRGVKPPVVFYRYDERSLFLKAEWDSDSSIKDFIKHASDSTHFVFFSSQNSKANVQHMHDRLTELAQGDKLLLERCHFVPEALDKVNPWISQVFKQWPCIDHGCGSDNIVFKQKEDVIHTALRLDGRYDWVMSMHSLVGKELPVVYVEDSCQSMSEPELKGTEPGGFKPAPWVVDESWQPPVQKTATNFSGKVVLTSGKGCDYYQKMKFASEHGAEALILYAGEGEPVVEIQCQNETCDYSPIPIPATMISYLDALAVVLSVEAGLVTLSFNNTDLPHFYFMSDYFGNLAEGGWFLYPSLLFLDFEAMWFDYTARMHRRITEPALVMPILKNQEMHGPAGANVSITVPRYEELRLYETVELLVNFNCSGHFDKDCAIWDRTVGLSICCSGQEGTPLCNYELGRWITPFRRRIGYWLTDVTPLLPLLKSNDGVCTVAMRTDPWALPWYVSLDILLKKKHTSMYEDKASSNSKTITDATGAFLAPSSMVSMIHGGKTFDKHYNNRSIFKFTVPEGVRAVRLVSVITGHGSDNNGCGEFCVTQHVMTINEKVNYTIEFNNAGTALGCAMNVPLGVVPNEHGTWLYGRDGWCDGQEVQPWVVDLSKDVDLSGSTINTISYNGYFNHHDPNPTSSPGMMEVFSEVVFYTPVEV